MRRSVGIALAVIACLAVIWSLVWAATIYVGDRGVPGASHDQNGAAASYSLNTSEPGWHTDYTPFASRAFPLLLY